MPVNEVLRPVVASLNSHRVLLYSFISTVAVSAAIANALKSHSNFYSVAIYLSKSSRSVLILANFGFLVALFCGHIVQQIFFGPLRAAEIERLYDRLWFFVTESLLAFTIFRDDFDIPFALMFGFLLFVKSFHWLAADRIEWMDQRPYPGPPPLFHVRMAGLFVILYTTDFLMFIIAAEHTMTNGVGGMVLFASEYAVLMASVLNTIAKYFLSAFELRRAGRRGGENAPPWENKSIWTFYIELITDFLKLTTYLIFFTVIITFYGLPLNIVRDVYITARSFVTRLRALHRYQTATRNMDQRYPNATEEEMAAISDRTCIICREEMVLQTPTENRSDVPPVQAPTPVPDGPNTTPKKLPCGHIFHFHCLRMWLERQQSCPTCRRSVFEANPPTPGVDARGPPPQGGVPQPPNLFGVPAPGLNNPLGLVGRLFGVPGQPPAVPGQFPHGQFQPHPAVNMPQNPVNFGFGPGQQVPPGVVIQYHIQYLPRQYPQLLPTPAPPQPLHPVPPFAGFHGPGGVWQPWGMHQRWFEPGQNPPQPDPPRAPTTPIPPTTQARDPVTSTRAHSNPPPPSPSASSESSSSTISNDNERPSTPREAAALAALRRFNGSTTARPSDGNVGTSSSVASTSGETEVPSVLQPSSDDIGPNAGVSSPHGRLDIPMMIPLPEYGPPGISNFQGLPVHSPYAPAPQVLSQPPNYRPPTGTRQSGNFVPQQMPLGPQNQTGVQRPQPRPSTPRVIVDPRLHQPRAPMSQLPPTLTEEQLSLMDRVTREAIDERLRVLEGVSGAVYRCIDDLVRMRSALPTPTPMAPAPPSRPHSDASPLGSDVSGSISHSPIAKAQPSISTGTEEFNSGATQDSASSGSELNDTPLNPLPDTSYPSVSESHTIPQEDGTHNDTEP